MMSKLKKVMPEEIFVIRGPKSEFGEHDAGYWDTVDDGEQKYIRADLCKQPQEWQPIETAPKDGAEIILCNSEGATSGWFEDEEWRIFRHRSSTGEILFWLNPRPTHWMPLPQPPKGEA